MNKATESKLILAELGQEVTMTLDEFIDAGGWVVYGHNRYFLHHTSPNISVELVDDQHTTVVKLDTSFNNSWLMNTMNKHCNTFSNSSFLRKTDYEHIFYNYNIISLYE